MNSVLISLSSSGGYLALTYGAASDSKPSVCVGLGLTFHSECVQGLGTVAMSVSVLLGLCLGTMFCTFCLRLGLGGMFCVSCVVGSTVCAREVE